MKTNALKQILSLIDLTSLNETDSDASITALCKKAVMPFGHVAAVCICPPFVRLARQLLPSHIPVATVANFPHGNDSLESVITSIQQSIANGAQEIDVVMPYTRYLQGDVSGVKDFIRECKQACGPSVLLKVILETGALQDENIIANASRDVLLAGADFIKTSTGKIPVGATLSAARAMLMTIQEVSLSLDRPIGFKASGGVRTLEQATQYIELAQQMMGDGWVSPQTFRLGASQLVDTLAAME